MTRKVERLLEYLEFKGITENKATVDCQLSQGLIYRAKSGKSDLGGRAIEKILNTYQDLSRVWLLTGEGDMLVTQQSQPQVAAEEKPVASGSLVEYLERKIQELERENAELLQENAVLRYENRRLASDKRESADIAISSLSADAR